MFSTDARPPDSDIAAATLSSSPSPAADVIFTTLAHGNRHHGKSNSQPESSRSSSAAAQQSSRPESTTADRMAPTEEKSSASLTSHLSRRSPRAFLLDSGVSSNVRSTPLSIPPATSRQRASKVQDRKTRGDAGGRASGESHSSMRNSPLSRELPLHNASSMDPAQLVQMALSLSENRKRHVSNTLPVSVLPANGRRSITPLDSGHDTMPSALSTRKRASYLIDGVAKSPPSDLQTPSAAAVGGNENMMYTFSPATLSRAEKARRYFELASEHRRLLEHLPPLKSDATAPGNYILQATSSPGTAHYDMARIPSHTNSKHQLGRPYNPLQALRNRRLRNIAKRPLTAPPEIWQETDTIRRWIDGVEAASKDASYRPGDDHVCIPDFSGELEASAPLRPGTSSRHRRTDTVNSVITRPENGWSIEPAELLADTYWTEKDQNKLIIEDRHGNAVFSNRWRRSLDAPLASRELAGPIDTQHGEQSQHWNSEDDEKNRTKRKHKLTIPGRLRRIPISRSASVSSASSNEGRKPPVLRFGDAEGGDENVGPLERHMRAMIVKDENGELPSPGIVSPDYWDSKHHTHFPNSRSSMDRPHRDVGKVANRGFSVDTQVQKRSRSAEGRLASIDRGMSSMDEVVSSTPSSPGISGFITAFTGEAPPPDTYLPTSQQRSKTLKLPSFRSRSKERNRIDHTDFAAKTGSQLSPVMSVDTVRGQPRSSSELAYRPRVTRQRTAESNASSMRRTNTSNPASDATGKDSSSSVGLRFLKGGRIGELVRSEGTRLGDRFRSNREEPISGILTRPSDLSDSEADPDGRQTRTDAVDGNSTQASPRTSFEEEGDPPRYFTSNLPSFKSPSGRSKRSPAKPLFEMDYAFEKPRVGPSRTTSSGHAPKLHLLDEGNASKPELSPKKTNNIRSSGEYLDLRKSASQNNLALAETTATTRASGKARPLLGTRLTAPEAKRHWSISDQTHQERLSKITSRDAARVRTLLLATGIKAHEISVKAGSVPNMPASCLVEAAKLAGQKTDNVARKAEYLAAARILSRAVKSTMIDVEASLQDIQNQYFKILGIRQEDLSNRVSDQLTKLVHETSDEADAFNVELTTKQPQDVKRVDEAVDEMFRQRRRQFRMFRRAGFKILEWLVLGIMWWVWFIVVLINTFKGLVVFLARTIRWLVWF